MTERNDKDLGVIGDLVASYAVGGPGLAGARALGSVLGEDRRAEPYDPAPIGSDPWLRVEIGSAIARESGLDASRVTVRVHEAIVTLSGQIDAAQHARLEKAVRSVDGIKRLVDELTH